MQDIHLDHPIAVLIRGLPGSGKSYLTTRLRAAIGHDAVVIDPDAVDQTSDEYKRHVASQEAEGVDPKLHLYRFSRNRAYKAIEDHNVLIWNQPFTNLEIFAKMVERLTTHATECGTTLPILVVEVEIDPELASKRVAERKAAGGHGPSADTFARFVREYTTSRGQGYSVMTIQGDGDTKLSVDSVYDAMQNLA